MNSQIIMNKSAKNISCTKSIFIHTQSNQIVRLVFIFLNNRRNNPVTITFHLWSNQNVSSCFIVLWELLISDHSHMSIWTHSSIWSNNVLEVLWERLIFKTTCIINNTNNTKKSWDYVYVTKWVMTTASLRSFY